MKIYVFQSTFAGRWDPDFRPGKKAASRVVCFCKLLTDRRDRKSVV